MLGLRDSTARFLPFTALKTGALNPSRETRGVVESFTETGLDTRLWGRERASRAL